MKRNLSCLAWLALCLLAAPAWADPPKVKPTADQLRLLDQALRAAQGGKHEEAAQLYQRALEIAPLNVAYLGLGRAHQRLGACVPAWRAFQAALDAPVSDDPRTPPDKVREGLTRFLGELRQTCPDKAGDLRVACTPADLSLTIDGKPAACGQPVELPAGPHAVVGALDGRSVEVTATVPPFDLQELRLQLPAAAPSGDPAPPSDEPDEPPQPPAWRAPLGWGLLAFGGLNLGLGLGLSLAVDDINQDLSDQSTADLVDAERVAGLRDDGDTYQTLQWVAYGLGVGSVVGGALLLWVWDESWPLALVPAWSPQGAGLTLDARF